MSTSELETPTVSAFVGTPSPELDSLQLLRDQAAPTSGRARRTISDSRYAAARVGVDFLSTCLALVVALPFLATYSRVPTNSIHHFWGNIGANALFPFAVVLAIAIGGTYRTNQGQLGSSTFKELKDVLFAVSVGCVITLAVGTYLHAVAGTLRPVAAQEVVAVVLAVMFISFGRVILRASLHTLTVTRVLIVGSGSLTDRITTYLGLRPGVEIVGHVVGEEELDPGALGTVDELPSLCRDLNVQQVIVGFPSCHSEKFVGIYRQASEQCAHRFRPPVLRVGFVPGSARRPGRVATG